MRGLGRTGSGERKKADKTQGEGRVTGKKISSACRRTGNLNLKKSNSN